VKPSAKGATQVDARAPSPDQEDAVYSQSLGDFIALDSSDLASPSQKGASAAKESPSNVGQGAAQPAVPTVASEAAAEAPWERASTRISSPMLRLHNGKCFYMAACIWTVQITEPAFGCLTKTPCTVCQVHDLWHVH
jgi:hypothetical protein